MREHLIESFMRGWIDATAGLARPASVYSEGAYSQGFNAGTTAKACARDLAAWHADRVMASPAMKQARANAESGAKS